MTVSADALLSNDGLVAVHGRCTIGEGPDFACSAELADGACARIACEAIAGPDALGREAIAYLGGLGRIAGTVTQVDPSGFTIGIEACPERRVRIEERLAWLRAYDGGLPDRRGSARIVPLHRGTMVRLADGQARDAEIADLSRSGAALVLADRPSVGAVITVGKRFATVVRHLDEGIGVAFRLPFSADTFNEHVVL